MDWSNFVVMPNVEMLIATAASLMDPGRIVPGMGVIYGRAGLGKSYAALWYADKEAARTEKDRRPVYIRALESDSPRKFMERLVYELGHVPRYLLSDLYDQAESHLRENRRLLIVDECDRLTRKWRGVEILRDLTDQTGVPVLMIGEERMVEKIARHGRLFYRTKAHILEFQPMTLADIRHFADQVCKIKLNDSAIEWIFEKTSGKTGSKIGEVVTEIDKAEKIAEANDYKEIKGEHLRRAA